MGIFNRSKKNYNTSVIDYISYSLSIYNSDDDTARRILKQFERFQRRAAKVIKVSGTVP